MGYLNVIEVSETEKWDNIVKSFEKYDVNYLCRYAKAFQLNGEGNPLLFYYDDGDTRAINVVMKRDIAHIEPFKDQLPLETWFDISTPYGYGGFLIEGENYKAVNDSYDSYCKDQGFVSEFVRFHLFSDYQPYYNGVSETPNRNIVRTLDMDLDDMWMDFEHKVRKSLKKAAKTGLEIETDTSGSRLDEFLRIYYSTMDRSSANDKFYYPEEFFNTLNEMQDSFIYFHVLYEGKVISTELVLYGIENCYSFLGGTNREYFHLNSNNFLKYEIIKWAKSRGLKRFILGGGYGIDDGIFKYKKSFAPNGIYHFYVGKKIFDNDKYTKLVNMRGKNKYGKENNSFFPLYRS